MPVRKGALTAMIDDVRLFSPILDEDDTDSEIVPLRWSSRQRLRFTRSTFSTKEAIYKFSPMAPNPGAH